MLPISHECYLGRASGWSTSDSQTPCEVLRYNERTAAERTNGRLKEEFGGSTVMVRGHAKVKLHLMFGIIALFADQLLCLGR